MPTIQVSHLSKYYCVHQKEPGLSGTLRSFFKRKYQEVKAVDNISFEISAGELVGFIGPNGAGKTTTLKVLSGLLYPTAGEVRVLGFDPWQRRSEFQKQMSLVMGQKNQLWWDLPAQETFRLNKEIYEISDASYQETLNELVDLLDIQGLLSVQVRKLSLGQRMKCELVAALLHRPRVLFLDEPTIGLDVVAQKKMRDFIAEYNRRFNATIILTTHYMGDVKQLCQRVIMIDQGKIGYDGPLGQITKRYARKKRLVVMLSQDVPKERFLGIGPITSYSSDQVEFSVPREQVASAAAKLLADFPVADLNIEEVPIEEIIREVFQANR